MTRSLMETISPKITRRLAAAEGYLELGMPEASLRELNKLSDAGPLSASFHYLKGEALRDLEEFEAAVVELELAARQLPAPFKRFAWESLSPCYEALGNEAMARMAFMLSQGEVNQWDEADFDQDDLEELDLESDLDEALLEMLLDEIEEEKDELI